MATTAVKEGPPGVHLEPMNLDDDHECIVLRAQRVICGWKLDGAPKWREQMRQGRRVLFWICLPPELFVAGSSLRNHYDSPDTSSLSKVLRASSEHIPIGHISLDREDLGDPPAEKESTLADGVSTMTITTLFVLPEFRKYGIATWSMLELERMARKPQYGFERCKAVTINTLSDTYFDANNPEVIAMWKSIDRPMRLKSTIGWYESMGYKKYRSDVPRYYNKANDGKEFLLDATFMRKEL